MSRQKRRNVNKSRFRFAPGKTEAGASNTLAEYMSGMTGAWFARVETADIGSHSPLIIGIKG